MLLIVPLLFACGNDENEADPPDATSVPEQDPAAILAAASVRIGATQSLRFTLDIQGSTFVDDAKTIQLLSARGTLARPGLVDVQFQVRLLGTQTASIWMITAGDQSWTTDLISGEWGPAPEEFGYDPSRLFDTQDGLGPIMGKITNPVVAGEETIADRATWHIHGTVPQSIIGPITANTMHGDPVTFDMWIDQETSDVLRVRLIEPGDEDKDPATWVMDLRDHDKPVTIEPPV
jgi:hypothetical protein